MNQKQIGLILIIIGIILAIAVYSVKMKDDTLINKVIQEQNGSCYLSDGTCLHDDRDFTPYIVGWIIAAALVILGIYLEFFDRAQEILMRQNREVSLALKDAKKKDSEKETFNAFLSGFNDDEKNVLKAIREQDGILQSTLRFRTGMSKTSLSLLLKSLEERDIISRKISGKTKQVFLRKKF